MLASISCKFLAGNFLINDCEEIFEAIENIPYRNHSTYRSWWWWINDPCKINALALHDKLVYMYYVPNV